jgi:hypothetical protein
VTPRTSLRSSESLFRPALPTSSCRPTSLRLPPIAPLCARPLESVQPPRHPLGDPRRPQSWAPQPPRRSRRPPRALRWSFVQLRRLKGPPLIWSLAHLLVSEASPPPPTLTPLTPPARSARVSFGWPPHSYPPPPISPTRPSPSPARPPRRALLRLDVAYESFLLIKDKAVRVLVVY